MNETSDSSADALSGFDDVVRSTMATWHVPGLSIAIVKDDAVVYSQGFGRREVGADLGVTPRTLFPIASCTKAFTATALGILVDEGTIDWDTPVRHYLPDFRLFDASAGERITPRDLLTHRSGLPRHDLLWYHTPLSRAELVARLRWLEPSLDLRTGYQYNNLMFMVAGYLVEAVTGQTWEDFTRERVFAPLGMIHTLFSTVEARATTDFAVPHQETDGRVTSIPFYDVQGAVAPAGAIVSCVEDLSSWVRLQLARGRFGGRDVISAAQLNQIHTPQMVTPGAGKYAEIPNVASYALGWQVQVYRGQTIITHTGGINGFSSRVAFLPEHRVGVAILTNLGAAALTHTAVAYNVFDRLLGLEPIPWNERFQAEWDAWKGAESAKKATDAAERSRDARPSHPLVSYVGAYEHPGYGSVVVVADGDNLRATYNGLALPLNHVHYDIFDTHVPYWEERLTFNFATDIRGEIASVAIPMEPSVPDVVFRRVPPPSLRAPEYLARFVGAYEWNGIRIDVRRRGSGALLLVIEGEPPREFLPIRENEFEGRGLSTYRIRFESGPNAAVEQAVIIQPFGIFRARRRG